MNERGVVNGTVAVFLSDMFELFMPLRWFALAALVIIFVDLKFGVQAAYKRGDKVRFSRAVRRTFNKIMDYVAWILVAGTFGKAFGGVFGVEFLPAIVLLVIFGLELNSCFANYFEIHDKKFRVDIFKYFAKKMDIIDVDDEENEYGKE